MPSYNTTTAALALGVDPKWLDNLLSHHDVPGAPRSRQGVPRRLTDRAVLTVALARELVELLGTPLPRALRLADALLSAPDGSVGDDVLDVRVDRAALESNLDRALAHAVEIAPHPTRGRPPGSRTAGHRAAHGVDDSPPPP